MNKLLIIYLSFNLNLLNGGKYYISEKSKKEEITNNEKFDYILNIMNEESDKEVENIIAEIKKEKEKKYILSALNKKKEYRFTTEELSNYLDFVHKNDKKKAIKKLNNKLNNHQ